jgi:hypothetical protein
LPPPTPDRPASLPVKETTDRDGSRFEIDTRKRAFGALLLALCGPGFGVAIFLAALVSWFLAAFLTVCLALPFLYIALTAMTERTIVDVSRQDIRRFVRPFPLARARVQSTADIDRFESIQVGASWVVRVVMRDGRIDPIWLAFADARHAAYMAGRLNDELVRLREPSTYRGTAVQAAVGTPRLRVDAREDTREEEDEEASAERRLGE